jgi:hypothetical protein
MQRRKFIALTGAATLPLVAGCTDDDEEGEEENETEDGLEDEEENETDDDEDDV